ncbi:ATP-binding protein [Labedaea rhizosphaerae]|uniref:histidine kinase n=1 Tax=Labedaea rhizosphaerae TaxID=598644 RepID=A0A4R6RST5_LABRH|nr:ATP-binding protein [Labedaea rhizosphaerae]TDP89921.1 histidine kinase/DNA gyrase B/HSP90-like ATPase [Labedaea rhizosphaerae]
MPEQNPLPHPDRRKPVARPLLAALVTAVLVGGLWFWVTTTTPHDARLPVAIAGGVTGLLLCFAVFLAVYRADAVHTSEVSVRRAWEDTQQIRGAAEHMRGELARLLDQVVPALVQKLREASSAESALAEIGQPPDELHQRILRTLATEIAVGERRRAAAMAACANAAGRVQALSTSMLADLREMENRSSEDMLGDLMKVDHSTAQAGRLADSIAVLTGARSGRRWTKPIKMESILRGAMGRIGAYQRVRVHSTSTTAIAGYAAEDVMHALAELMDNATKFSAPSEEVHVYVEDLHNGTVITIEDGGLGMKPQALARAELAVSPTEPLDLTMLSGTRLGLAVVGVLSRKHHLHVFFRPSSRGGIGVVMRIPNQLITQPRLEPLPEAIPQRRPVAVGAPAAVAALEAPTLTATDSRTDGRTDTAPGEPLELPQRTRGQTLQSAQPARHVAEPSLTERPRGDAGSRFGAFQQSRTRRSIEAVEPAEPSWPEHNDA